MTNTPTLPHSSPPTSPLRLVSLAFLLAGVWMFGSSLYSRCAVAPELKRIAEEMRNAERGMRNEESPQLRNPSLALMRRATWLVFGGGLFVPRLNRQGDVPEYVANRSLAQVADEFQKMLDEEKKAAEKLLLIPDPAVAAKYGPTCAQYVARLAVLRAKNEAPSEADAMAEIMSCVEAHLRSVFIDRYGEPATTLVLTYRGADIAGQLTAENKGTLNAQWRQLIEKEIDDFSQLATINGRNGYVFSAFLFLASATFLLVSIFARSMIPQVAPPDEPAAPPDKRT